MNRVHADPPSTCRVRKALPLPSISSRRRPTRLPEMPDIPTALPGSQTERGEPWTSASCSTPAQRRRPSGLDRRRPNGQSHRARTDGAPMGDPIGLGPMAPRWAIPSGSDQWRSDRQPQRARTGGAAMGDSAWPWRAPSAFARFLDGGRSRAHSRPCATACESSGNSCPPCAWADAARRPRRVTAHPRTTGGHALTPAPVAIQLRRTPRAGGVSPQAAPVTSPTSRSIRRSMARPAAGLPPPFFEAVHRMIAARPAAGASRPPDP